MRAVDRIAFLRYFPKWWCDPSRSWWAVSWVTSRWTKSPAALAPAPSRWGTTGTGFGGYHRLSEVRTTRIALHARVVGLAIDDCECTKQLRPEVGDYFAERTDMDLPQHQYIINSFYWRSPLKVVNYTESMLDCSDYLAFVTKISNFQNEIIRSLGWSTPLTLSRLSTLYLWRKTNLHVLLLIRLILDWILHS